MGLSSELLSRTESAIALSTPDVFTLFYGAIAACSITSATASGWETITTAELDGSFVDIRSKTRNVDQCLHVSIVKCYAIAFTASSVDKTALARYPGLINTAL